MPGTERVLAFPVYPGVTPLDLIGPLGQIQEYARHNGHADIIRELIDGTTGE